MQLGCSRLEPCAAAGDPRLGVRVPPRATPTHVVGRTGVLSRAAAASTSPGIGHDDEDSTSALSARSAPNLGDDADGLAALLAVLPPSVASAIDALPTRAPPGTPCREGLLEIVLDLGRPPEGRFLTLGAGGAGFGSGDALAPASPDGADVTPSAAAAGGQRVLRPALVTREELESVAAALGDFGGDNRAGLEGTLHRVSALRSRRGALVGLTCRVGRVAVGSADLCRDVLSSGDASSPSPSLLFLGRPGVGKTTVVRELARVLSVDLGKRVVVVDTSNEIGGDGDVPHPALGLARRMQVPDVARQHETMIEASVLLPSVGMSPAISPSPHSHTHLPTPPPPLPSQAVENHTPEVVIVDEISSAEEALACRTIAERGITLISTAHGLLLENLVKNPALSDLVGGVAAVTLGDEEARARGTQKSVLERQGPPTFPLVFEMRSRDVWCAHWAEDSVDALLAGRSPVVQFRTRDPVTGAARCREAVYDGQGMPPGGAGFEDSCTFLEGH